MASSIFHLIEYADIQHLMVEKNIWILIRKFYAYIFLTGNIENMWRICHAYQNISVELLLLITTHLVSCCNRWMGYHAFHSLLDSHVMTRYIFFIDSNKELNMTSSVLMSYPSFIVCFFHVAFIAFGGPASTPEAPLPAKRCEACTLWTVSHAWMVSNARSSRF